jgi:hypothetical protein
MFKLPSRFALLPSRFELLPSRFAFLRLACFCITEVNNRFLQGHLGALDIAVLGTLVARAKTYSHESNKIASCIEY